MRAAIAAALALGLGAVQPDAARVLADMRQAIGGDAAIAAIQAFSVSGTESHNFGGHVSSASLEWMVVLPDNVVRVRRMSMPFGSDMMASGFRGDARILRRDSDIPYPPEPDQADTPAQRAARDAAAVRYQKHDFSRFAIPLIGIPAVDPVDVSHEAQRLIAGKMCDVLRLRASDGYSAALAIDVATHLPVMVSWIAPPTVTVSTTSIVTVPSQGGRPPATMPAPPPPSLPAGDPTAGLAPVEWQLYYEDFKLADGLNWPHRFVEKTGDRVWTTVRLGKFKLNPKIDPKHFDPARR